MNARLSLFCLLAIAALLLLGLVPSFAGPLSPAPADELSAADPTSPDGTGYVMPIWGGLDTEGNQNKVREWQGRHYDTPDIEQLYIESVSKDLAVKFFMANPFDHDGSLALRLDKSYYFSLDVYWDQLTHRVNRWRLPLLVRGPGLPAIPQFYGEGLLSPGKVFPPFTPVQDFIVRRDVIEVQPRFIWCALPGLNWVADFWQQSKGGTFPLPYYVGSGQVNTVTQDIDQQTRDASFGFDTRIGRAALSLRHEAIAFTNSAPPITQPAGFPGSPRSGDGIIAVVPDNTGHVETGKMRLDLGKNVFLAGSLIQRERRNEFSNESLGLRTLALDVSYYPTHALQVNALYRRQRSHVTNEDSPKREWTLWGANARYQPIRWLNLRAGYEHKKVNRTGAMAEPEEVPSRPGSGQEVELTADETTWKTWNLGATARPTRNLTLRVDYKHDSLDRPEFGIVFPFPGYETIPASVNSGVTWVNMPFGGGVATKRGVTNASLNYTPLDRLIFYADYRNLDESNDLNGYHNHDRLWNVGSWLMVSKRLSLNADYADYHQDADAMWVVEGGWSEPDPITGLPTPQNLPWPNSELVPWSGRTKVWNVNGTYAVTDRIKVFGGYRRTDADQFTVSQNFDEFLAPLIIHELTPIHDLITRWSIGVNLRVKEDLEVTGELARDVWDDRFDPINNGKADIATISLKQKF